MAKKNNQEFMGMPVDTSKAGVAKVSKSDQNKILDELGVTKDVRTVIAEAEAAILEAAIDFNGQNVVDTKKDSQLILGSGDSRVIDTTKAKSVTRNPADGSKIVSFGSASIRKRGIVPKALKEGAIDKWSKKIEKVMK